MSVRCWKEDLVQPAFHLVFGEVDQRFVGKQDMYGDVVSCDYSSKPRSEVRRGALPRKTALGAPDHRFCGKRGFLCVHQLSNTVASVI